MSNSMPFFSIILPIYNSKKTITAAVNSVIKQSFNSWELILIDDLSSDSTRDILSKIKHPNIRIIYNNQNFGVSESRNIGIRNSKGKYILFLDSDDIYQDGLLVYIYNQFNNIHENVDIIKFGFSEKYNIRGKHSIYPINLTYSLYTKRDDIVRCIVELEKKPAFGYVWNSVYKRSLILENKIYFDKNISINEDFFFNINYINKSESILCLPFNGYTYIKTNSCLSNSSVDYLSLNLMKIEILVSLIDHVNISLYKDIFWMYVRFIYSSVARANYSYNDFKHLMNNIFKNELFNKFKLIDFSDFSIKKRIMIFFLKKKIIFPIFLMSNVFRFLRLKFPFLFSVIKR